VRYVKAPPPQRWQFSRTVSTLVKAVRHAYRSVRGAYILLSATPFRRGSTVDNRPGEVTDVETRPAATNALIQMQAKLLALSPHILYRSQYR